MNENLRFYDALRCVPDEAKKQITAGRLKGFTDINPVYRIKIMTETFGVCGFGWKYEIVKQWEEQHGNETKVFTNVNLFIKINEEWSEPIPGTGGSTLVEVNSKGMYVNDEGYKMSLTDALSVAMKSLGVAADVYFNKSSMNFETKYAAANATVPQATLPQPQAHDIMNDEILRAYALPAIEQAQTKDELLKIYNDYVSLQKNPQFISALSKRRKEVLI